MSQQVSMVDQYQIGSGRFIVVGIWPDRVARVGSCIKPDEHFQRWRNRYGAFLPVVCHWVEVSQHFVDDALQLPRPFDVNGAAEVLGWAGVDYSVRSIVLHVIRELGELGVSLFSDWRKAVSNCRQALPINDHPCRAID